MNIQTSLKFIKHFAFLSLVFYTFIPCSIKGFIADNFETFYAKPISNPKVSNNVNTCFVTDLKVQESSLNQQKKIKEIVSFDDYAFTKYKIFNLSHSFAFPYKLKGKSPPKYILFKRLKIATV